MIKIFWIFVYLCVITKFCNGYGERTKDKMYEKIKTALPCYRRLNATHQIGCSSKRGGSTGVIHYCENYNDLNFILTNGTASPYIPVIPMQLLERNTLDQMIKSEKVSGLILFNTNETLSHFTHDNQCPNPQSSAPNTCSKKSPWNPYGTGLLFVDIPFPVFNLEQENEIIKIKECYQKFNNYSFNEQTDRPLCSLELKSFMYATVNTPVCRRRSNIISNLNPVKFCDPLGDSNIWASLYPLVEGPRNETVPLKNFKYIVVATRMDTTSLFDKTTGASTPVTGMVTSLATAKYLKNILSFEDIKNAKLNVLFIYFNGETYDYIGSQRLLYDMDNGDFPVEKPNNVTLPVIRPDDVELFIEFNQLGNSKKGQFFVHNLRGVQQVLDFYNNLPTNSSLSFKLVNDSVPPASLHTFLKSDLNFPGLVISDHKTAYSNHFYNSILDDIHNINFVYENDTFEVKTIPEDSIQYLIAKVSVAVGNAIHARIKSVPYQGEDGTKELVPLVNELLHCYLENPNCKVANATQKGVSFPNMPLSLYVGVDRYIRLVTTFTYYTIGWLTGDIVSESVNCTNKPKSYAYRFYNMSYSVDELNVTKCYMITINMTDAISPAFKITNYNWTSGVYSTWTESTWKDIGVRMFLRPSVAHERMSLVVGSVSLICSFLVVYYINKKSQILFTPPLPTDAPTDC